MAHLQARKCWWPFVAPYGQVSRSKRLTYFSDEDPSNKGGGDGRNKSRQGVTATLPGGRAWWAGETW
jgi:hypothetical protein